MGDKKKILSLIAGIVVLVLAAVLNIPINTGDQTSTGDDQQATVALASSGQRGADAQSASAGKTASGGQTASAGTSTASKAASGKNASGAASSGAASSGKRAADADPAQVTVVEDGTYITKDEVAAYIHEFGHLPPNFISKTKARKAGWVSSQGNLDEVCPGKSIGGSVFYNDEGLLPDAEGRTWKECDINYTGGFRGGERIVFSNDGLIFYTGDHYASYEQLY